MRARERWGRFLRDHRRPGTADLEAAEAEFSAVTAKAGVRAYTWKALAYGGLARVALVRDQFGRQWNETLVFTPMKRPAVTDRGDKFFSLPAAAPVAIEGLIPYLK